MSETQNIVNAFRRLAPGQRAALATIVSLEGSSYRRPGARMLITDSGETTGVLSAGCFEQDVCERARKVILTGEPVLVKYDTTTDDDIVWGLGLGCNGVVHVLIEPTTNKHGLMQLLEECAESDSAAAIATVFRSSNKSLGATAFLYADGTVDGQFVAPSIFEDLREVVRNGKSAIKRYEIADGYLDVFLEVVRPPARLVIFGAGHDAMPVVRLAKSLGWHTSVVDTRARAASLERFKEADAVWLCRPEDVSKQVPLSERTAVVLMTHNYLHDLELLRQLLAFRLRYLGCLGPKKRTERLLLDLSAEDTWFVRANLSRLHAPVGLDIGAETAEEIALSIVSEIQAVLSERPGAALRDREGSIHARSASLIFAVPTLAEVGHPIGDFTTVEAGVVCEV
ncbi:MAG TPA: XdhC family protein [Pyrinomonadaceae bacterium]|nr:XdhC family protein [Pyrinomonadaceae bacterium]